MLKSKALLPHPQTGASQTILPIDPAFINGKKHMTKYPLYQKKLDGIQPWKHKSTLSTAL